MGVAQAWQHLSRDVLLEELQRPSRGGIVAVDHCNRTIRDVKIVCIGGGARFPSMVDFARTGNRSPAVITSPRVLFMRASASIFVNVRQRLLPGQQYRQLFHGRTPLRSALSLLCWFINRLVSRVPLAEIYSRSCTADISVATRCYSRLFGRRSRSSSLFGDERPFRS